MSSTTLITLGTGCVSWAGTIGGLMSGSLVNAMIISSVASATLGLVAQYACKEKDESLTNKEIVLITGGSLAGAATAGATIFLAGSVILASAMINVFTQILFMPLLIPLCILSSLTERTVLPLR